MATLKVIKKRIASVKSSQKITRAMKLVSAAKLKRATERAHASRPFENEVRKIVSTILTELEGSWKSPLLEERPIRKVALLVISSDRGLAGSLNANIMKMAYRRIQELGSSVSVDVIGLGKKAADFLKRRGVKVQTTHTDFARNASVDRLAQISRELRDLFLDGTYDRIEIIYSQFQSALVQKATNVTMLPFAPVQPTAGTQLAKPFILEPEGPALLDKLVPMLIDFQLYQAVLEAVASEHGARMSAMESATKNAKDMIDSLTLQRNRARQAVITKELLEIIGGAEALSA